MIQAERCCALRDDACNVQLLVIIDHLKEISRCTLVEQIVTTVLCDYILDEAEHQPYGVLMIFSQNSSELEICIQDMHIFSRRKLCNSSSIVWDASCSGNTNYPLHGSVRKSLDTSFVQGYKPQYLECTHSSTNSPGS